MDGTSNGAHPRTVGLLVPEIWGPEAKIGEFLVCSYYQLEWAENWQSAVILCVEFIYDTLDTATLVKPCDTQWSRNENGNFVVWQLLLGGMD